MSFLWTRLARKELNVPKIKSSQGLTVLIYICTVKQGVLETFEYEAAQFDSLQLEVPSRSVKILWAHFKMGPQRNLQFWVLGTYITTWHSVLEWILKKRSLHRPESSLRTLCPDPKLPQLESLRISDKFKISKISRT